MNRYYNICNNHLITLKDIIISLKSTAEVALEIAKNAKKQRLKLNLSQKTLSEKSGVCYGTLKKFEQKGQISLESLIKIALVLDQLSPFEKLFSDKDKLPASIDELFHDTSRKRGRK